MAFDAEQRKINDILSGDFKYVIPRYQRKYVWQEKQWRELLDDIKYCLQIREEHNSKGSEWTHFLGSFVFERQDKNMIVIDGQQRLTTITIMLCSICTIFNELGDEPHFLGVTKYIIGRDDVGVDYVRVDNQDLKNFKLMVIEATSYNSLQGKSRLFSGSFLENSPQDNVNVKQCFYFFYNQFMEMIQASEDQRMTLSQIKDEIMGLDVIDIRASNQQESYNIFEILNARGVDLKQHELIKNYIFKYIQPKAQIDTAKMKWDAMEEKLYIKNRPTLDNFFTHYVSHRYEKPDKENTDFRIIKKYCNRPDMSKFLDDLCDKASIYRFFYCPEECENLIIRGCLQFFLLNNHRQFRPVFLSVISAFNHNRISKNQAELFFKFIKNFYFGYGVVCSGKSNTIEDMVYQYARKIENEDAGAAIIEIEQKLMEYYPTYNNFEENFILMGWSHSQKIYRSAARKKEMQYILSQIEEYLLASNQELSVKSFTLEHIANDDGTDTHCRIGNLLMIAEPINGGAANKSYQEKILYYERSNFQSTKNFVMRYGKLQEWTSQKIQERGKYMAKLAYEKIWKI